MSSRKVLGNFVRVGALALAGLAAAPALASDDDGSRHEIVVRGAGEVRVRPDSVRVDVGAEAQAATLEEARDQVNASMHRVLDALHRLAVPELAIETEQVRFSPVYGAAKEGSPPAIVGYSASNHLLVTLKHAQDDQLAARSAQIVDAALSSGANSIGNLDFFLADSSDAEDEALGLAVKNAARDARTIAEAAGVTLAGPFRIEEASAARAPRALVLEAATVSTPVEVGDIVIQSNVTASYTFQ